jgi:anti-sigma B factor antagonist
VAEVASGSHRNLLQIELLDEADPLVLRVSGEVDHMTAGMLTNSVTAATAVDRVVLDLSGVTFFDAAGVRVLIELREQAEGLVEVAETSPAVDRVLDLVDLSELGRLGQNGGHRARRHAAD